MTTATAGAAPQPVAKKNLFTEFKQFLDQYGVIGLAIAFVIGSALTKLVTAVVADLLMPIVGVLVPGGDWRTAKVTVPPSAAGDPTAHKIVFGLGDFIGNVLDFTIIAAFVFIVAKFLLREAKVTKK